ncbi:MAG: hypothetical protein ACI4KL_06290 [Lentihominibacter sp.]
MYIKGLIAYLLIFLHDFNDWKLGTKWLRICFPAGAILLAAVTITMCLPLEEAVVKPPWIRILLGAAGLALLWAEVYSLFFSFSGEEAYGSAKDTDNEIEEKGRELCTDRMYRLCRHPGVLFFILLYIDLWLCLGMDPAGMAELCGLNLLLAAFEDRLVFPKLFSGYDRYRETTPFLVPTCRSIRECVGDFRRRR